MLQSGDPKPLVYKLRFDWASKWVHDGYYMCVYIYIDLDG